MKTVYIYTLSCPTTGMPRYVGKTQVPDKRLAAHISKAKSGETAHYCAHWIRQLLARDLRPIFEVIFEVPSNEAWQDHEKRLIAEHLAAGCELTNLTGGGGGFYKANPELLTRRGRSIAMAFEDPDYKERFRKVVAEAHAKPEVKARHSDGCKSMWKDPAKRTLMIASMNTPEAKVRRAAATRKRYEDPSFRAAQSTAQRSSTARLEQLRLAGLKRWSDYRARKAQES